MSNLRLPTGAIGSGGDGEQVCTCPNVALAGSLGRSLVPFLQRCLSVPRWMVWLLHNRRFLVLRQTPSKHVPTLSRLLSCFAGLVQQALAAGSLSPSQLAGEAGAISLSLPPFGCPVPACVRVFGLWESVLCCLFNHFLIIVDAQFVCVCAVGRAIDAWSSLQCCRERTHDSSALACID
jgi:hypothetical protein